MYSWECFCCMEAAGWLGTAVTRGCEYNLWHLYSMEWQVSSHCYTAVGGNVGVIQLLVSGLITWLVTTNTPLSHGTTVMVMKMLRMDHCSSVLVRRTDLGKVWPGGHTWPFTFIWVVLLRFVLFASFVIILESKLNLTAIGNDLKSSTPPDEQSK